MSNGFRGSNQYHDHKGSRIGTVPQQRLLPMLRILIDKAQEEHPSATRDQARAALRDLHENAHWKTPFVLRNIGAKRCRYLARLGWAVPTVYLSPRPGDLERLNANFGLEK